MARRSPLNERYQKNTAPAGKTRKSAAAAKPKRDAGGASKSKSPAKKKSTYLGNPTTPEFQRLRKIWWWLLGSSMVVTLGSLAVQSWTPYDKVARVMLGIGYTLIFYAIYLDWTKLRKMRKEWADSGGKPQGKKPSEKTADKSAEKGADNTAESKPHDDKKS